jgi:hypothetical protein
VRLGVFVLLSIFLFLVLVVPFAVPYLMLTRFGECSFEEVRCDRLGEAVASKPVALGAWGALALLSVLAAWAIVYARRRR